VALLLLLAWFNRFIQDDAFISFRYARNIARGLGPVWNQGERVEGYTNFLWTLIMALPHAAGISPVGFSFGLGLVLFGVSLYLAYRVAAPILGTAGRGLLVVLLLGTNYTFSAFATSGMETQLQTCLVCLAVFVLLNREDGRAPGPGRLGLLSGVLGLAILTRPDSALPAVALLVAAFRTTSRSRAGRVGGRLALLAPVLVLAGGWLVWKTLFYGNLLPNTFHAKAPDLTSVPRGCYYLAVFIITYFFFLLIPSAARAVKRLLMTKETGLGVAAALTALWLAYVLAFGGDFMEFRMLVPVTPFLFILMVWTLFNVVRNRGLRIALLAAVIAGSVFHGAFYGKGLLRRNPESVRQLAGHLTREDENWAGIGRALGRVFGPDADVVIATTAAGAIPYYSGLKAVDMLGLNDPWVARAGRPIGSRPGHRRVATVAHLVEKGVNLVIGHPTLVRSDSAAGALELSEFIPGFRDDDHVPDGARLIEIPIDRGYRLVVLYLLRSECVDRAIAEHGWNVRAVPPPRPRAYRATDTGIRASSSCSVQAAASAPLMA